MNLVIEKLEQERERAEVCDIKSSALLLKVIKLYTVLLQRLENQINDITELHQHEVTNNIPVKH